MEGNPFRRIGIISHALLYRLHEKMKKKRTNRQRNKLERGRYQRRDQEIACLFKSIYTPFTYPINILATVLIVSLNHDKDFLPPQNHGQA